ncbi:Ig domain-containing protein [Geoalkalibacter halelectricus]|uniref:Ig domain-containing protein n=2 Tax=Geoalkalibacter halelectricus TaxID=2847045 RepID=A0ABY5ZK87_9BACT|nr:Ig domain-containing protein [Geoalkalibacter halelectricus]UWZ79560.1 Ig domain-containing protein [Geoalkalibacter halelectricus]
MRYFFHGMLLLIFSLGMSGCRGSEPQSAAPGAAESARTVSASAETAAEDSSADTTQPSVSLHPDPPIGAAEVRARLRNLPGEYDLVWERNGRLIEGAQGEVLPKGQVARGDMLTVRVRYEGGEVSASARVGNSPPEISVINFAEPRIHRGVDIILEPVAHDADGDPISFRYQWWINGEEVPGRTDARLPGDLFHKGDRVAVKVIPMDAHGDGIPVTGREFTIPPGSPQFVSQPPANFEGRVYRYQARAQDPDGEPVRYSLAEAPEGMRIDADSGQITWNVENAPPGEHRIRIRALDSEGLEAFQEFTLSLASPEQEG